MTPFKRWLKKAAEKYAASFYEGPEPPQRLADMVTVFANMYPNATRAEWVSFASGHAQECYRSGFVRGYEAFERDDDPEWRHFRPEELADQMDPNWRWQPMPVVLDLPFERVEDEPLEDITALMRRAKGMFR